MLIAAFHLILNINKFLKSQKYLKQALVLWNNRDTYFGLPFFRRLYQVLFATSEYVKKAYKQGPKYKVKLTPNPES
jgi:hypothetical protein